MSIFQTSILKTYKQDESKIAQRWAKFQNYLSKVEFVKGVKEEKYQDGFLHDLFEECLGYTLDNTNPQNFNLEREKKNETDGKKADGVIYVNGEVVGIVELKDQKSKNLDAIEAQAFNYHNSHSSSKYIIISNFDELRFYIDKKTAYEKFNLFYLTYDEFKKLHLLLSFESIKEGLPLKLKEKSANFEQQISKELYRDFSIFRTHLFENIVKNNYAVRPELVEGYNLDSVRPEPVEGYNLNKPTLLRLTQKLCDRIIFILFAEDRGLLRHNTIKEIREEFKAQKFTSYTLYDIYKFYFEAINKGNEKLGIPKYNGGLFAKDEMLDVLAIDDAALDVEAQKLSDYDFVSDISVNILGHIFEQSLTDLEELSASINDTDFDKKKSKRKKDGVFYTPEYITRYIVQNTLGKLCEDKKAELNITETIPVIASETKQSIKNKLPRAQALAITQYKENLLSYREWLTNLKILDPACGSGAFLNQALEFLIKEHTVTRDMLLPFGDLTIGYEIETSILEHNLYGVDINEDAVEIARLSLWLRTAHRGRTLTNLSGKIKCGNSLIDDKAVAENAFAWEDEFPEVFAQGGFDVVIGNPPYVARGMNTDLKKYLKNNFKTAQYQFDLYVSFMEKGILILKEFGYIGYIVPNSWLKNLMMSDCRKFLLDHLSLQLIIPTLENVFSDASVDTMIFTGKKSIHAQNVLIEKFINETTVFKHSIMQNRFLNNNGYLFDVEINDSIFPIINKMSISTYSIEELFDVIRGINPYDKYQGQSQEIISSRAYHSNIKKNETFVPELKGQHIARYCYNWDGNHFISYGNWLAAPRNIKYFSGERIIFREILGKTLVSTLITEDFKIDRSLYIAKLQKNQFDIKYILGILNSKLMAFYFRYTSNEFDNIFPKIRVAEFKKLPIKHINIEQQNDLSIKTDLMLSLNKNLRETKQNFLNELKLEKLTKKLQNFEELEFDEFVNEYAKVKKLKFADKLQERNFKQEWQAIFENDKILTCRLKDEIAKTDKEIDEMVYKLYNLTDDEIKIVEGSQ